MTMDHLNEVQSTAVETAKDLMQYLAKVRHPDEVEVKKKKASETSE